MAEITLEELNGLISDLVNAESPSCERLVAVVERTIRPTVKKWAGSSRLLDGEADDLMQEIQIKIMKQHQNLQMITKMTVTVSLIYVCMEQKIIQIIPLMECWQ